MHKHKKQHLKGVSILAAVLMAIALMPVSALAVEEYGYNEATASGRPYNGTNLVAITDMIFPAFWSLTMSRPMATVISLRQTPVHIRRYIYDGRWDAFRA